MRLHLLQHFTMCVLLFPETMTAGRSSGKNDGMEEGLPVGTSIIMTERSEERSTTDFWYYKVQEKVSRIDLNKFTRMSGE